MPRERRKEKRKKKEERRKEAEVRRKKRRRAKEEERERGKRRFTHLGKTAEGEKFLTGPVSDFYPRGFYWVFKGGRAREGSGKGVGPVRRDSRRLSGHPFSL